MALTEIEKVRLWIGATESSPFYELITDDEIQYFLDLNSNDVFEAARMGCSAMYLKVIAIPSREVTGEIEVWNEYRKGYLDYLNKIISSNNPLSLRGVTPWAAGISWEDVKLNLDNSDVVKTKLQQFTYDESLKDLCDDKYKLQ